MVANHNQFVSTPFIACFGLNSLEHSFSKRLWFCNDDSRLRAVEWLQCFSLFMMFCSFEQLCHLPLPNCPPQPPPAPPPMQQNPPKTKVMLLLQYKGTEKGLRLFFAIFHLLFIQSVSTKLGCLPKAAFFELWIDNPDSVSSSLQACPTFRSVPGKGGSWD